jgi:hypothetical protein
MLGASSQLKANFHSIILSPFGHSLNIKLLYCSIQFCWHFLSFKLKYSF